MEDAKNVISVCKCCSDKARAEFQKGFDKYALSIGDYVKKGFIEKKEVEHMWVKILELHKNFIVGRLDNEPFVLKNLKSGDIVKVKFEEVENWIKE